MRLKRASIFTKLVVFALLIYATATLINLRNRIETSRAEQENILQQIEEKQVSNAEMEYAIENSEDDEIIADIARDQLGYVAPGEKVFYDTENQNVP